MRKVACTTTFSSVLHGFAAGVSFDDNMGAQLHFVMLKLDLVQKAVGKGE